MYLVEKVEYIQGRGDILVCKIPKGDVSLNDRIEIYINDIFYRRYALLGIERIDSYSNNCGLVIGGNKLTQYLLQNPTDKIFIVVQKQPKEISLQNVLKSEIQKQQKPEINLFKILIQAIKEVKSDNGALHNAIYNIDWSDATTEDNALIDMIYIVDKYMKKS